MEAKSVEAAGLVDGANALVIEFGDPQGFVEIRELELIHELECNPGGRAACRRRGKPRLRNQLPTSETMV
jgi:hypothetical protein